MRAMRVVCGLILLSLLSACGDRSERLVRISRFDCVTALEGNTFAWGSGISHWSAGGPGGATWNASKLHCAVEIQTPCTKGTADAELRIGGALVAARRAVIEKSGSQLIFFELLPNHWEPHFDQGSPWTEGFPYRMATFAASVMAKCEAPEPLGPGNGPRLEFADDRHFTAGFASGE